jgi:hypothetical protein
MKVNLTFYQYCWELGPCSRDTNLECALLCFEYIYIKKSKAVPLQAWGGPEGSRKLMCPEFLTTAQVGGKVVSLTHRPHLTPGNSPGTHFC